MEFCVFFFIGGRFRLRMFLLFGFSFDSVKISVFFFFKWFGFI